MSKSIHLIVLALISLAVAAARAEVGEVVFVVPDIYSATVPHEATDETRQQAAKACAILNPASQRFWPRRSNRISVSIGLQKSRVSTAFFGA